MSKGSLPLVIVAVSDCPGASRHSIELQGAWKPGGVPGRSVDSPGLARRWLRRVAQIESSKTGLRRRVTNEVCSVRQPFPMGLKQFDLTGKVAAVTGGGRGLGLAIAKALAACGAKVVVGSRKIGECESAAGTINAEYGREAMAQVVDVRDRGACEQFVAAAVRRFGGLDILMSNAGVSIPKAALETDECEWQRTLDVDLTGCFNISVVAARHMIEKDRGGAIVVTSSNAGTLAFSRLTAYAAAKG